MDLVSSTHVVGLDGVLVGKLSSLEDESDHGNIDTFLLLEGELDLVDGVCWVEVEGLLHSCEGLDEQLHVDWLFVCKINNLYDYIFTRYKYLN